MTLRRLARRVYKRVRKLRYGRAQIPIIHVKLTEHCNLDCIGCNVFSPIASKSFLDLKSYAKDLRRVRKLLGRKFGVILMGGEPLLHPEIAEFCRVTRKVVPREKISVLTNGVRALKMPEEFWEAMKSNKITLSVTKYPIDIDHDKIKQTCRERGVQFEYNGGEKSMDAFIIQAVDPEGNGDPRDNYTRCSVKHCTNLMDGRLYPCFLPLSIEHFNKYFGYDIPVSAEDYVDIYAAKSGREVMRKLYWRRKPMPFCRYCDIDSKLTSFVEYRRSKKELSEWVNAELPRE